MTNSSAVLGAETVVVCNCTHSPFCTVRSSLEVGLAGGVAFRAAPPMEFLQQRPSEMLFQQDTRSKLTVPQWLWLHSTDVRLQKLLQAPHMLAATCLLKPGVASWLPSHAAAMCPRTACSLGALRRVILRVPGACPAMLLPALWTHLFTLGGPGLQAVWGLVLARRGEDGSYIKY